MNSSRAKQMWSTSSGTISIDGGHLIVQETRGERLFALPMDVLEVVFTPWESERGSGSIVYLRADACVALRVPTLRAPASRCGPARAHDARADMDLEPCVDMLGSIAAWREREALRAGEGSGLAARSQPAAEVGGVAVSERLRTAVLEHLAEGVNLVSPEDGRILFTNRQFDEMFGYERGELIGRHVAILNAPTELTPVGRSTAILKALRRTGRWRGEVFNRRKDGSTFWCYAVSRAFDEPGHGRVWLTTQMDITIQKQAEERLSHASRLMGLGTLGAGIAHELNQPLGAILSLAKLMEVSPAAHIGEFSVELRLIIQQTQRMARIVDNIRAFASKRSLTLVRGDALRSLDDALLLMRDQIREEGIELVQEFQPSLPPIVADHVQLQQVFINLLSNSVLALRGLPPERARRVFVRARVAREQLEYQVEDSGPGIPFEIAPKIFEPFFSTREVGEGTGLGLSIVYGIVSAHGGEIEYIPVEAGGARFVIRIPLASSVEAEEQTQPAVAGDILVVGATSGARISTALRRDDWHIHEASSRDETLSILADRKGGAPVVAVIVLGTPGVDGSSLCRELRSSRLDVSIIALVGEGHEDITRQLEELGVDAILSESVPPAELRRTIAVLL